MTWTCYSSSFRGTKPIAGLQQWPSSSSFILATIAAGFYRRLRIAEEFTIHRFWYLMQSVAMKELDDLMNIIMGNIVGNTRLPKIEIEEPDSDNAFLANCRKGSDGCTINPITFHGLRKLTQFVGVASLVYRLNQGSLWSLKSLNLVRTLKCVYRREYYAPARRILHAKAFIRITRWMWWNNLFAWKTFEEKTA